MKDARLARKWTGRWVSWKFRRHIPLYIMILPALIGLLLFSYYPMYGIVIAFQKFDPLLGFVKSPWVGLDNFERLFARRDFWEILRNTLTISFGKLIFGQIVAIIFALMLNEVRHRFFKRAVQTLTYLPYFLSWLVFAGILNSILSLDGMMNQILGFFGIEKVYFLGKPHIFPWTMIFTDVWKGFGWGAIIYLAALTGIDSALYEAAAVDGANRWQRMLHITLPGMVPTILVMFTLSLGYVMSAGFEQILVLYNPAVYKTGDIIDTFVYRAGLLNFQYSLATAVGLFKSVVGFVLISISYYVAHKYANYRIF